MVYVHVTMMCCIQQELVIKLSSMRGIELYSDGSICIVMDEYANNNYVV